MADKKTISISTAKVALVVFPLILLFTGGNIQSMLSAFQFFVAFDMMAILFALLVMLLVNYKIYHKKSHTKDEVNIFNQIAKGIKRFFVLEIIYGSMIFFVSYSTDTALSVLVVVAWFLYQFFGNTIKKTITQKNFN